MASVSVGIFQSTPILDLNYLEDSSADTDMNVVMNDKLEYIEVQGTAEELAYSHNELLKMLELAKAGINDLIAIQKQVINA